MATHSSHARDFTELSELRKDPVTGRWVIISTDRARRPTDFTREPAKLKGGFCPFCYGNESRTPPEILALRPHNNGYAAPRDSSNWTTRVVPNKFPALGVEGALERRAEGIFDNMSGVGAHEVIIETPDHRQTLASMPVERLQDAFWAFRERINDLKRDTRLRYMMIFKNHGEGAGATLEHPHFQLIALPIVPIQVADEMDGARHYHQQKERCLFCDIVHQEITAGVRVVAENDHMVTLSPYAPRFPFETWILPKRHESAFENASDEVYHHLARALRALVSKCERVLENPAYNLVLHTSPVGEATNEYYHWHMELMPKLTRAAGFEFGSGFFINPTPPEEATRFLREANVEQWHPVGM